MGRPPADVTDSVSAPRLEPGRVDVHAWSIEVTSGPDKGKRVRTLASLLRIGTDPSNDLVLEDSTVSRRHVEIERDRDGLQVRDLGSRNGTVLGGRKVLHAYLEDGDKLSLGKTRLQLKVEREATPVEVEGADAFGALNGRSEAMRMVFAELRRAAREQFNLLLEGETGTGKELAARAVHEASARRHGPFRVIDCNLLTEANAERELFGAAADEPGLFELAQGGTVFLDEVGGLPASIQPKLLRVLESLEVRRLGETEPRTIDVRVIASTQKNLDEEVRLGHFRKDLYFRLAVARVRLPPLRARREDLPVLAPALCRTLGVEVALSPQTLQLFESYEWPGNVRELRNVLERAAVMDGAGSTSWLDFLPRSDAPEGQAPASGDAAQGPRSAARRAAVPRGQGPGPPRLRARLFCRGDEAGRLRLPAGRAEDRTVDAESLPSVEKERPSPQGPQERRGA